MITMALTQSQLFKYHGMYLMLPFNIRFKHKTLKTGIKKMVFLHILRQQQTKLFWVSSSDIDLYGFFLHFVSAKEE